MREEFEETKIVKHFRITCDFCGYSKVDTYSDFGNCAICGKLGCYKCGQFFYEGGSDHHSHFGCYKHKDIIQKAYNEHSDFEDTVPDLDYFISKKKEGL